MAEAADHHVESYLRRVEEELADLPKSRRRELLEQLREHIVDARAELEPDDELGVLTVLDRLGDPQAIANEARERTYAGGRTGGRELFAVVLLIIGGVVVPVVGWIVGVILLWASEVWTRKDKLIGTLVIPGGLLLPVAVVAIVASADYFRGYVNCVEPPPGSAAAPICSDPITTADHVVWVGAVIALVVLMTVAAGYLIRRSRTGCYQIG